MLLTQNQWEGRFMVLTFWTLEIDKNEKKVGWWHRSYTQNSCLVLFMKFMIENIYFIVIIFLINWNSPIIYKKINNRMNFCDKSFLINLFLFLFFFSYLYSYVFFLSLLCKKNWNQLVKTVLLERLRLNPLERSKESSFHIS